MTWVNRKKKMNADIIKGQWWMEIWGRSKKQFYNGVFFSGLSLRSWKHLAIQSENRLSWPCIVTVFVETVLGKYPQKQMLKAVDGNFGVNMNNFLCSVWKKCHNTHRQLLVSGVVWEFREISRHASVFRIGKNLIAPALFAQSVLLSVLSVPTGRSTCAS